MTVDEAVNYRGFAVGIVIDILQAEVRRLRIENESVSHSGDMWMIEVESLKTEVQRLQEENERLKIISQAALIER